MMTDVQNAIKNGEMSSIRVIVESVDKYNH